jgi:2,3-bisphosphoglycerate-dependent phosphoglycerate mutase
VELYLIRHGQSTNNALGTDIGRSQDPALTEIGVQQAEAVAAHLANGPYPESRLDNRDSYQIDHLYCSAMQRALQTAQPIGKVLGLTPEVWVDVHEQGGIFLKEQNGAYQGYGGMTRAEILAGFPDYVLPAAISETGWWNRGFETVPMATGRALAVAEDLLERGPGSDQRIAIVSHGFFLNLLIKALFNQLPAIGMYYHHHNTGITRFDIRPDGFISLRYLNRISHLSPDLVTR